MLDVLTRPHVTVGRIAGIPVSLNLSWFPVFALVAWSLATGFLPQAVPGVQPLPCWIAALGGTACFFGSILAHEFGHALVAIRCGIPVSNVTLFVLGGVSRIAEEPRTGREELLIAAAGPAVSVLCAVVFLFAGVLAGGSRVASAVAFYLVLVNAALAIFNLLPALPLDGGRMLRAAMWSITGDVFAATKWAALGGRACGIFFALLGVVSLAFGAIVPAAWLLLLGIFIERSAKGSVETIELDVHVPPAAQVLHAFPEGMMDEQRFRRVEAKVIAWRARLDVLPRPAELTAEAGDGEDGPATRQYVDDRMRMYELLSEVETGVKAQMSDEEIDARFARLAALHDAWRPVAFTDPATPEAGEDAMLAGRPERYAPDPEEALQREPGSSIEV